MGKSTLSMAMFNNYSIHFSISKLDISHRIHGAAIYGNMDPINIPPMLAYIYIAYMDPMCIVKPFINHQLSRPQVCRVTRQGPTVAPGSRPAGATA